MNEETLLQETLSRPPEDRAAFLETTCEGRPELRATVEALLATHEASGRIPDRPRADPATVDLPAGTSAVDPTDVTGDHIPGAVEPAASRGRTSEHRPETGAGSVIAGRYTLLGEIGEGGMGVVWIAQQTEPVRRKVALKLIKAGMDSRAVLARFEQERQALAMMDHPNIARVLDGGLTPTGQPFFVMELVNGLPLTRFCDEARLTTDERLALFVPICQAVQHAHQKGIIHRDLKPANILVATIDGKPVPKVIDFGVAKATAGKLTDASMSTQFGAIIGTLEYMSPEQAGLSDGDIDTRADIYSLGVILYELLTGLRPIDARRLKKAALTEVIRIIQHEDPPKPSTRLSGDESLAALAASRHTDPRKLMAALRGELDWVVMKCLEKARERRYETANALARDIQRYLADEPVEARPPSAGYRFGKFLERNKGAVIAAGLLILALLAGIAGTTFGLIRADRAREEAEESGRNAERSRNLAVAASKRAERSREEAVAASKRADANASTARRAVNDYLDRITSNPQLQRPGLSGLRRDLLTQALTYYEGFLRDSADDPVLQAEAADAQNRAAMTLSELGELARSIEASKRAIALNERLIKDQPGRWAHRYRLGASLVSLGNALRTTRRSEEAIAAYRRSAEISEAILKDHPDNLDVAANLGVAWSSLSKTLDMTGKVAEAGALQARARQHLEALVARAPALPKPRDLLADTLHELGDQASDRGEFEAARDLYLEGLKIREGLVREHPEDWWQLSQLARIENELGLLHFHNNRPAEALPYYEKSRALRERLLAAEPASADLQEYLARSLDNLGNLFNSLGKPADAVPMFERCIELRGRVVANAPDNASVRGSLGGSLHNLAMSREQLGRDDDAERLYREAMTHQRKALEVQPEVVVHRSFLTNHLLGLADLLRRTGKVDDAARLGEEAAGLWQPQQANPLMRSALFLAECVASVGPGDSAEKVESRERIGKAAVSVLSKAVDGGVRALPFFQTSNQLDPIRGRDDFKSLVGRMERASGATK